MATPPAHRLCDRPRRPAGLCRVRGRSDGRARLCGGGGRSASSGCILSRHECLKGASTADFGETARTGRGHRAPALTYTRESDGLATHMADARAVARHAVEPAAWPPLELPGGLLCCTICSLQRASGALQPPTCTASEPSLQCRRSAATDARLYGPHR